MSTILVRHTGDEESSTEEVAQLNVLVDLEDFEGLFDQLEVWRGAASAGPFEELTSDRWRSAVLPKTAGDRPASPVTGPSVVIVGKTLEVMVNELHELAVTFTGADPLSFATAASQVTAQGMGLILAYVAADGVFVLESAAPGLVTSIRITGGDAAPLLGLPVNTISYGHDPRIGLRDGVDQYILTDPHSKRAFFYKTRFRNKTSGTTSEFSLPFSAGTNKSIGRTFVVVGRLELVGNDGRPLPNMPVSVYCATQASLVDGKLVSEMQQTQVSDQDGAVEFHLIRGSKMTVAISGTGIVRDIVVPTDPNISTFNLLGEEASVTNDVFKVQVPNVIGAERRTL